MGGLLSEFGNENTAWGLGGNLQDQRSYVQQEKIDAFLHQPPANGMPSAGYYWKPIDHTAWACNTEGN